MTDPLTIIEEEATLPLLTAYVQGWGEDKGLLGNDAQPLKQYSKTVEEVNELGEALEEYQSYLEPVDKTHMAGFEEAYQHALMELGDCLVTLTLLARQMGSTTSECLELAWNKIKVRKGELRDGVFVKSEDLV